MKRFRIIERVVFEYVWIVDAEDRQSAESCIEATGDGEAVDASEVSRQFLSCTPAPRARRALVAP